MFRRMSRLVFTLWLMCGALSLMAQDADLAAADRFGMQVPFPVRDRASLDSLLRLIDQRFRHPVEKVRALFTWVATTMEYDCGNDSSSAVQALTVDQVLRKGKSQCAGYSNLLQYGLRQLGFEQATIRGVARTAKKDLWWTEGDLRANHSWNAVRIDGKWRLLDATWASGASNDDCSVVNREFAPYYFFPDPATFILSHLPTDSNWQLLDKPMTKGEFLRLPVFHDPYYELPVTRFAPESGVLDLEAGQTIVFSFRSAKPLERIAVWSEENTAVIPEFGNFTRTGDVYSYGYRVRFPGHYFLNVSLDGKRTAMVYYVNAGAR